MSGLVTGSVIANETISSACLPKAGNNLPFIRARVFTTENTEDCTKGHRAFGLFLSNVSARDIAGIEDARSPALRQGPGG